MARFSLPRPPMGRVWERFRNAARLLLRAPGFVAAVVLPLGLALGANTALFSVVRGVLLRPLPYPEPERLVRIRRASPDRANGLTGPVSPLNYKDDLKTFPGFEKAAAWNMGSGTIGYGQSSEHVDVGVATASYLSVLRVSPRLGRWFSEDEETLGNDREMVISQSLWQRRFGSDPGVLGRTVEFEGLPYTIVGVLPAEPALTDAADVWVPLAFRPDQVEPQARNRHFLDAIGRLAPGVSREHANQKLAEVAQRTIADHPEAYGSFKPWHFFAVTQHDYQVRSVRPTLDPALRRGGPGAADGLRQRGQSAPRPGHHPRARAGGARGAGRGSGRADPSASHRERAPGTRGRRAGCARWPRGPCRSCSPSHPDAMLPNRMRCGSTEWCCSSLWLLSIGAGLLFGVFPAFSTSQVSLDEALRSGAASSRPTTAPPPSDPGGDRRGTGAGPALRHGAAGPELREHVQGRPRLSRAGRDDACG